MNLNDVALLRLISLHIANAKHKHADEVVSSLGAMQAQDYAMAKMAIGVRMQNTTLTQIEHELDKGSVLRTHLLRPTWHFVAAEDIRWMLELTAPSILSSQKTRHKELELNADIFKKCNAILLKILKDNQHLTRDEIIEHLEKANIKTHDQRAAHLMFEAELAGIICSGKAKGKDTTYALLNERLPGKPAAFNRENALEKLALKYFTTRGPATVKDFSWWSGMSLTDSKKALEMIQANLISKELNGETYWIAKSLLSSTAEPDPVYLLPAFDEFIISYKDRSATITFENHKKAVSNNGIFRPVIVVNGTVTGIWKRSIKKDSLIFETEFFKTPDAKTKALIMEKAERIGKFLELKNTEWKQ